MKSRLAAHMLALGLLVSTCARASIELGSFEISPEFPAQNLFASIGPQHVPGPEAGPGATIAWPVAINTALLNTLPATIRINFPDRVPVTLTHMSSERRGNTIRWSGRGGDCSALLRVAPHRVKGSISCISAPYGIGHEEGSQSVRLTRYDDAGNAVWDEGLVGAVIEEPLGDPGHSTTPLGAVDTTVDILVLYNGSLTSLNIWENAHDQVQLIQHAMELSTTTGQSTIANVRLAGAARISRTTSGVSLIALQYLRNDPETAALRDYYAGDVVLYLSTGACDAPGVLQGIAYLPGNSGVPVPSHSDASNWAFAASLLQCSDNDGDWVAAHEVAHVFGANHNQDQIPANPTPLESYAWGYWDIEQGTDDPLGSRTIMAYADECLEVADSCPRILHYSNPGVSVGWFTTGEEKTSENAKLIRLYAPMLAQYRDSQGRIFRYGFDT